MRFMTVGFYKHELEIGSSHDYILRSHDYLYRFSIYNKVKQCSQIFLTCLIDTVALFGNLDNALFLL
jgi:hypothetical protein